MFLGISDAVFIFSALLKPIRGYTASLGVPNQIYLDDQLTGGATKSLAISNNAVANDVLAKAGWIVSTSKKNGPLQRILFLGLEICSVTMKFYIPEKKIISLLAKADSLLSCHKVQLRVLASFIGLLQSCSRALGPIVRLMTRNLYGFLMSNVQSSSWNFFVALDENVVFEINFWQANVRDLNGFHFKASLSMIDIHHQMVSDASNIGIFGYRFFSNEYEVMLRRALTEREIKRSSTDRELLAVEEIYTGPDAVKLAGSVVRHLIDNQSVVNILANGSKKKRLHEMAVNIFLNCRRLNITLFAEWTPRTDPLIVHADWGSRIFDESSYSLDLPSFSALLEYFNIVIEVDVMADYWNKKCVMYFTRFPDPHAAAVNFFAQRLYQGVVYYCFPPPSLYTAAILHFQKYGVKGLLLVPVWKTASFWNNVVPDGVHLPSWVKSFLVFRPSGFIVDPNVSSFTFKQKPVAFDMLGLVFDFSICAEENIFVSFKSASNCMKYGCARCA